MQRSSSMRSPSGASTKAAVGQSAAASPRAGSAGALTRWRISARQTLAGQRRSTMWASISSPKKRSTLRMA